MERATLHLFGEISPFDVSARLVQERLAALGDVTEIEMLIHSPGGDVAEGFSIFHQVLAHPARIIAHVQAFAASMASVVAMAADEVRIAENAFLVVHNPFFPLISGDATDLRHAADLLDAFKANAIRAYQRHTSLSNAQLIAMMDAETWLTAGDAIKHGFAQVMTGRLEAVSRLDLSRFQHVPSSARQLILNPGGQAMSKKPAALPGANDAPDSTTDLPSSETDETVESLWSRLGQMIFRRSSPEKETKTEGVLTHNEVAAVLALERQALQADRARLRLDQDLGPYRAAIEPAQLEKLEPILLKLKTAELTGDQDAGGQYASLAALLPSLKSTKTGGELAGSDAGSLTASNEVSAVRKTIDERHGINDERRDALMRKYAGCRPGTVQEHR